MIDLSLSALNPSPDAIKAQLRSYLNGTRTWDSAVNSPVGDVILSIIAAVGALDQAKILRAHQESFRETALSDSSLYALADSSGIRIVRKSPATCTALITSTKASILLPAYSSFEYAGNFLFTREAYVLPINTPTTINLYEGQVIVNTSQGLGVDYSSFVTTEDSFLVSDSDVQVTINGNLIEKTYDGIWTLQGIAGYQDRTLPDGRTMLLFGNAHGGSKPLTTDLVGIQYVVTKGLDANNINLYGRTINLITDATVTGSITSLFSNGTNERSALEYKNLPYPVYGTFSSAITRSQFITSAVEYPGVVDAITYAQREINPKSLSWLGVIRIALLTNTVWTTSNKSAFIQYMKDRCLYGTEILLETPDPDLVDIQVKLYCYSWANLTQVEQDVSNALDNMFALRAGLLGYDFYKTDISQTIQNASKGIEYFEVTSPVDNIITSVRTVNYPEATIVSTGGSLAIGSYTYGIAVDLGYGLGAPLNWTDVSITVAGSQIQLAWEAVSGATSYVVYGRQYTGPGTLGQLSTLTSVVTSFTDDGSTIPGSVPLDSNDFTTRYAKLNSKTITSLYSNRGTR
jgi:hypothetical protein